MSLGKRAEFELQTWLYKVKQYLVLVSVGNTTTGGGFSILFGVGINLSFCPGITGKSFDSVVFQPETADQKVARSSS